MRHVSSRLPFLLDLMNVCVHGDDVRSELGLLVKRAKTVDENLAYVVKKTSERAKIVGLDRAHRVLRLSPNDGSTKLRHDATQSLKYGSSVGAVLASLAS